MEIVQQGVSNFRSFQTEARDFFSRADERAEIAKTLDKRRNFWIGIWAALISGLIIAGFSALLAWAINFEQRHHISEQHTISQAQDAGSIWPERR